MILKSFKEKKNYIGRNLDLHKEMRSVGKRMN